MTLLISFFNGRSKPDAELKDWGSNGHKLRIKSFTQTLGTFRIHNDDWDELDLDPLIVGDLVLIDGVYYADYSIMDDPKFDESIAQPIEINGVTFMGYPPDEVDPENEVRPDHEFIELTDDEWAEQFKPVMGDDYSLKFLDWAEAQTLVAENKVWTLLEGDDGLYISSGVHYVNRLEYVATEVPYPACKDYQVPWVLNSEIEELAG